MRTTVKGWLFDLYPSPEGITLWLIDEEGAKKRCHAPFVPCFYLHLSPADRKRVPPLVSRCGIPLSIDFTTKTELYSNKAWDVVQINVHDATRMREAVSFFERFFPHFAFFNSDIPVQQLYLYHTGLFPLAYGEYFIEEEDTLRDGISPLRDWILHDRLDVLEYTTPPLTLMVLRNANPDFIGLPPKYQQHLQLEISYNGTTYMLEEENPHDLLQTVNWHLHREDPDILVTEYGDATLLPTLTRLAQQLRVPLLLNRDHQTGYFTSRESSYFQYGKIVHKDGAFELAGRWHIDMENSFTIGEADLDGLFEVARLTQIPGQHQARTTIGSGLSSMQLSWAYRNNVLIPSKKREPEDFKPASTLLLADRGGLIFQPPLGYHERVAELDFVSMYPSIMEQHNVSPETINCRCCQNAVVPELGYTICEKRRGVVPETLGPVLRKRAYYKQKKRELKSRNDPRWKLYDHRQNALKWMLVTCFGYLGYKNARFGKIEAHESVNAFSRETILHTKEIAERSGFTFVHAIVDCIWLKKERASEEAYRHLCEEIRSAIGIDISLEGIYDWILFPASKMDPALPTANRYVGWYHHRELKVRGLEVRRRDTPRFVKNMQTEMLERMSLAQSIADIEEALPDLLEIVHRFLTILRSGHANPMELVIRRHISREAGEYTNNSVSALVAKMVENLGVHLAPGEMIEYIIIDQSGKKRPEKAIPLALYAFEDGYDIEKYTELLLKAAETTLLPFGQNLERLQEHFGLQRKPARRLLRPSPTKSQSNTATTQKTTETYHLFV